MREAVARQAGAVQPEKTPGTGLFAVRYCRRSARSVAYPSTLGQRLHRNL